MRLAIESLAHGGDAVGHLDDGRAAFVPYACPGDVVDARIAEDHGSYVRATVVEVLEPSGNRVTAPCPYFGECGGCQWQHVARRTQIDAKTDALRDSLIRIGHLDAPRVDRCSADDDAYGYRNKVELIPSDQNGRFTLGFKRTGSDEVMPIEACLLLPERARRAPAALQGALRYLSSGRDLGIVRVGIRVAAHTGDLEVALWTVPGPFPRKLAATTLSDAVGASGVVRCLVKGPVAARNVVGVEVLKGRGAWRERLDGRSYLVSAPSFFQVNTNMAEELERTAVALLDPAGERVLDVYAGVGTFTLPFAEITDVVAVESSGAAIADLRRNLAHAALDADILPGDAGRVLEGLDGFGHAIVDPPRAGLDTRVVDWLSSARLLKLVYVSCDPATLARDARLLEKAGMMLTRAVPLDLFPQTFHVESVALFERSCTR